MKIIGGLIALVVSIGFLSTINAQTSLALSGSEFNPGYIIDDGVFYNENALDAGSVQSFLNSKVPSCDTNGTQRATDKGRGDITHAQYAALQGWHGPPYTCLRNFTQNTPSLEGASGYCNPINAAGNQSAAQIIVTISKACHINPEVLLVLLQKEQSLVLDTWPLNSQYTKATGFACPDTAACDPAYNGFFYQVYYAARQYQVYKKNPNSYNYVAGRNNTIYFHPGPTVNGVKQGITYCGSTQVYIQNQATAALYIYTPYQPNGAALNNLYGTGDGCSSYGNRNFWRLFSDWFGSTTAKFTPLDTPRWMTVNTTQRKSNPSLGDQASVTEPVNAGTQLFFVDKIYVKNVWYLRTAFDSQNGNYFAIPLTSLSDISFEDFEQPRYMTLKSAVKKINPVTTRNYTDDIFANSTYIKLVDKILVNGLWYYRTEFDKTNGFVATFKASDLQDISFTPLETSRFMRIQNNTVKKNLRDNTVFSTSTEESDELIVDKTLIDGNWFYRTKSDRDSSNIYAFKADNVRNIEVSGIATPYTVRVISDAYKYSLSDKSQNSSYPLTKNQIIKITGIVTVDGTEFYQTEFDRNNANFSGIKLTDTAVESVSFVNLDTPRVISIKTTSQKINLLNGQVVGDQLNSGTQLRFVTKTEVKGKWYLRTEFDTNANSSYGIPLDNLNVTQ